MLLSTVAISAQSKESVAPASNTATSVGRNRGVIEHLISVKVTDTDTTEKFEGKINLTILN